MKKQILNYVTFLRGSEPRRPANLSKPLKRQIALLERYDLPATFLLQYDALVRKDFIRTLKKHPRFELGVWLEMNKPHAVAASIKWRGRFSWDPNADCAMSVGYTQQEREKLVDAIFERFDSIFGYYPRVVGAWAFDAHTLAYISDKYGADAFCNCKDQWGTDGYSLWGGYYGQAYYPSRSNAFCSAQNTENQIPVPVFRMLGSDPVLQYDHNLDAVDGVRSQGVVTLEPVYGEAGGGVKEWVDWYMAQNFSGNCLTFAYAQAGQENSFSWKQSKRGLTYQIPLFAKMRAEGKLIVETLGQSGKWFKETFPCTPPSAIVAENDWQGSGKRSVWYDCKNYRANFFADKDGTISIRDIYLFREDREERYLHSVCTGPTLLYDNLPVMDGVRFSGDGTKAGIYFLHDGKPLKCRDMHYSEIGDGICLDIVADNDYVITLLFSPDAIHVKGDALTLKPALSPRSADMLAATANENRVDFVYEGYSYRICANTPFEPDFSLNGDDIIITLA